MLSSFFRYLDTDDGPHRRAKIQAFQLVLALVLCVENWLRLLRQTGDPEARLVGIALVATLFAAGVFVPRWRRVSFGGWALFQLWILWASFPWAGNHRYLQLMLLALFALLDPDDEEEQALLLRAVRWLVILVFFYSGVQKLVHGYYFQGQFLAYSTWREHFRLAFQLVLPADELARLASYQRVIGPGPYLVSSPLFLVVSNTVWIAEIALGVGLFLRRTRQVAMVATIAFIVVTEVVAREVSFGCMYVSSLLLFSNRELNRPWLRICAVLLALMMLVGLGILPAVRIY